MVNILCTLCVVLVASGSCLAAPSPLKGEPNREETSGHFEGDILLTPEQEAILNGRTGLINERYRWPNNEVAYEIHAGSFTPEQVSHILMGLQDIERVTCIRFVKRTVESNYVNVTGTDNGCFSYVGHVGGAQQLNLQPYPVDTGCFRIGTIIHEFIHALGFYHMQSAYDRDEYVTIMWENIEPGLESNFAKHSNTTTTHFGVPYDIGSVMHYGPYGFSINGLPTIMPHDENDLAIMGQRYILADSDVERINRMYNCQR